MTGPLMQHRLMEPSLHERRVPFVYLWDITQLVDLLLFTLVLVSHESLPTPFAFQMRRLTNKE
jgi:hypothetical protein